MSQVANTPAFGNVLAMRTILLSAVLALGAGAACSKSADKSAEKASSVPLVSVDEMDQKLAKGDCVPVDANGTGTRKKMRTINAAIPARPIAPGAIRFHPRRHPSPRAASRP